MAQAAIAPRQSSPRPQQRRRAKHSRSASQILRPSMQPRLSVCSGCNRSTTCVHLLWCANRIDVQSRRTERASQIEVVAQSAKVRRQHQLERHACSTPHRRSETPLHSAAEDPSPVPPRPSAPIRRQPRQARPAPYDRHRADAAATRADRRYRPPCPATAA